MIYRFIDQYQSRWPVRVQCRVLDVATSGYYAWKGRGPSQRAVANQNLLQDSAHGPWRISHSPGMAMAIGNDFLASLGLVPLYVPKTT